MRRLRILAGVVLAAATVATSVGAITNGVPDGDAHPYVGVASSGDWFCSGTLLSPTVFLTAGHCTDAFASTGSPTYVTVDPNAGPNSVYVTGTPYTEPGFFNVPPRPSGQTTKYDSREARSCPVQPAAVARQLDPSSRASAPASTRWRSDPTSRE